MGWASNTKSVTGFNTAYNHYYISGYTMSVNGALQSNTPDCSWYTNPGDGTVRNVKSALSYFYSNNTIINSVTFYCTNPTGNFYTGTGLSASISYGSKAYPSIAIGLTDGAFVSYSSDASVPYTSNYISGITTQYSVTGGTLHYREHGTTAYSDIPFNGTTAYIPANTLTHSKTYDIYVTCTVDDGTTADSNVVQIVTTDKAAVATPIAPVYEVVYGSAVFEWSYSNEGGNPQYAYDIETSTDNSTFSIVLSHIITSSTKSSSVSFDTAGVYYWKVRAYNQDDVAGDWSESKSFTSVIPPTAPTIMSVKYSGRPIVSWSAADQIAYRVVIDGIYDSLPVYSTEKSHLINTYIPNGNYTIKVAIYNQYGLISDWATFSYSQNFTTYDFTFTVKQQEGYNEILINQNSKFAFYYILRDGIVIANITGNYFKDYFCCGLCNYTVRGITLNDYFTDETVSSTYTCKVPVLIDPSTKNIISLNKRLDNKPDIQYIDQLDYASVLYYGKVKPVHYFGTVTTRKWTESCAAKPEENGHVYFYRNYDGQKAFVICSGVTEKLNALGVNEYQFSLEETDYSEAIDYALPN